MMKTIKASELRSRCLELMDEVARSGASIVITKHGRPVAQLGPVVTRATTLAGAHAGMIQIHGDIVAPLDEGWEEA